MLQKTLKDHGYAVGNLDGVIGPATRRGLQAFAKDYGAPSDPDGAFTYILDLSEKARTPVTDPATLAKIKSAVAKQLRDPSSAMIRNVYRVTQFKTEIVCGEVNGKNGYGGYAGYTWFDVMPVLSDYLVMNIDTGGPGAGSFASYNCQLAFPAGKP